MMKYRKEIITALALIIVAVSTRLMPHVWNVTAAGAIAIASGLYLKGRLTILVPLIAMLVSDLIIGFYSPFVMASVYGSMALAVVIARSIKDRADNVGADSVSKGDQTNPFSGFASKVVVASTAGTIVFYIVTNWAVWFFGGMYAKTFAGLLQSYIAALPFLRNSFFGDLFWSFVVCGAVAGCYATITHLEKQTVQHKNGKELVSSSISLK